jgi:hypothetical protein
MTFANASPIYDDRGFFDGFPLAEREGYLFWEAAIIDRGHIDSARLGRSLALPRRECTFV